MNSALTTTRIAEVYLLMIRYNAFHPRIIPGFEIRLALAGAREWPKAPSGPRAGAVQLPPRRQPSHTDGPRLLVRCEESPSWFRGVYCMRLFVGRNLVPALLVAFMNSQVHDMCPSRVIVRPVLNPT